MLWYQGLCRRKHSEVTKNPTSSQLTSKDSHRSFSGGSENISEASKVCMNVQECLHSGWLRNGPYKFPKQYSFLSEIDSKLISCGISKDKRRKIGKDKKCRRSHLLICMLPSFLRIGERTLPKDSSILGLPVVLS